MSQSEASFEFTTQVGTERHSTKELENKRRKAFFKSTILHHVRRVREPRFRSICLRTRHAAARVCMCLRSCVCAFLRPFVCGTVRLSTGARAPQRSRTQRSTRHVTPAN